MTPILLCYATENYAKQQGALVKEAQEDGFRNFYLMNDIYLKTWTSFYKENKFVLDQKRGAGYWLWKPYFIKKLLEGTKDYDPVIYMDCGDRLKPGFMKFILEELKTKDQVFVQNTHINKYYTKRSCFVHMDCDEEKYWDAPILEAGVVAFRNTPENIEFVDEWLLWCKIPEVLMDEPRAKEDFPEFVCHKHDQSILTNLVIKYNLPTIPIQRMMKYVNYNVRG